MSAMNVRAWNATLTDVCWRVKVVFLIWNRNPSQNVPNSCLLIFLPLPNLKIAQLEHSPCKLLLVLRRPESGHLRKRIWNPQRTEARQNLLDEFSSQKEVFFKHRNGRKTGCFWKRLKWQVDRSWDFKEKVGYWLLKGLQLKYCMKYCINTIYSVWIQEIQEKNDKMGGSQQSKIFQAKEKPNE